MLTSAQLRRLLFLTALFVVAVALLYQHSTRTSRGTGEPSGPSAGDAPPPEVPAVRQEAPLPPPSRLPPGTVVFHGRLKAVEDFTPVRGLESDPGYRVLAEHAMTLNDEAFSRLSEGRLAYATYLQHAPELRGRVFRVSGLVVEPGEFVRLPQPILGREDLHRVFIFDYEEDVGYLCDLVERPGPLEKHDRVQLDGIFLKLARYEDKGGTMRETPVLIARRVGPVPAAPPAEQSGKLYAFKLTGVGILAAVLAAAFFILQRQSRQRYSPPLRRRPGRPGGGPFLSPGTPTSSGGPGSTAPPPGAGPGAPPGPAGGAGGAGEA